MVQSAIVSHQAYFMPHHNCKLDIIDYCFEELKNVSNTFMNNPLNYFFIIRIL